MRLLFQIVVAEHADRIFVPVMRAAHLEIILRCQSLILAVLLDIIVGTAVHFGREERLLYFDGLADAQGRVCR